MSGYLLCRTRMKWNKQTRSNQLLVSFVTELHSDNNLYCCKESETPDFSLGSTHFGFILMDMNLKSPLIYTITDKQIKAACFLAHGSHVHTEIFCFQLHNLVNINRPSVLDLQEHTEHHEYYTQSC